MATTVCAILSATVGTPRTLTPFPSDFGISTIRTGGGKVTPGRHPIPQFKQVPLQVLFELLDRYTVHSRRTLVGLHPSISLEDRLLGNTERLRSAHLVPPGKTG